MTPRCMMNSNIIVRQKLGLDKALIKYTIRN
eukprot:CAMPEP_0195532846 /NCGR_PEP_ID=MMETSP0794_2-20130614/39237_1 /TAXON_ID=515487 /ORGANISM="Stephanopyxis turris, Strain CCMP 815" /LENGTH=30 /DNA_ID= /DNA_START= /DNA_END= /DNA_ORIENTATION=